MNITPISQRRGESVLLETDFCTDVDDVAALSLLCGESLRHPEAFHIAGVSCNVQSEFMAPAVKALMHAFGISGVPVAVTSETPPHSGNSSQYLRGLAARWHGPAPERIAPLDLWQKVLRDAPDGSVSVISIGFFNNLAAVLDADPELFHRKVRCVWAMAGAYNAKAGVPEFNIAQIRFAAASFISHYKGPIVFCGWECGESIDTDLSGLPPECEAHPLVEAFRQFSGPAMRRSSWDPITVDLAVHGENQCYTLGPAGKVEVLGNGGVRFTQDENGNARVLQFSASDSAVSERITRLVRRAAGLPFKP